MTALADLLAGFRAAAVSEREKGTYFERADPRATSRTRPATRTSVREGLDVRRLGASAQGLKDARTRALIWWRRPRIRPRPTRSSASSTRPTIVSRRSDIDSFFTASGTEAVHASHHCRDDRQTIGAENAEDGAGAASSLLSRKDLTLLRSRGKPDRLGGVSSRVHRTGSLKARKSTPRPHQRSCDRRTSCSRA
jgi:hypothetical protein